LYETTVAVVIAVLVVLNFDERVRGVMTLPQRGRAIGWLGGIIALGIFMPVMTLAGFTPDDTRTRACTVIILASFVVAAFGIGISAWDREDRRRLQAAQTRTGIWGPDRQAARSSGSTEYDRRRSLACPARGLWLCGRAARLWRVVPLVPLWLSLGTQARPRRLEVGEPGARVDAELAS